MRKWLLLLCLLVLLAGTLVQAHPGPDPEADPWYGGWGRGYGGYGGWGGYGRGWGLG